MKGSKIWKIIWVLGIYIILFVILYLVILYKVEWEDKDLNTYLYFYNCNKDLCTSTTKVNNYYSKVLCKNDQCPYISEIIDDNVILDSNDGSYIYNYIDGTTVNNDYIKYKYLGNDLYIVTDEFNMQGIINESGNIIVSPMYEYISDYRNNFVSYRLDNLYGIDNSIDENINVDVKYEDIILINDKIYGAKSAGLYYIYSYKDDNVVNSKSYVYLKAYDDVILCINNKKIDLITVDLKSTLLMKINTFYEYRVEKEIESLNLRSDGEYIYFDVFKNENEYVSYKYNIATKKIV